MSLAVVYSDKYLIDLAGLEKLHPYDTQKYRRIYQQLIKDGLLNEKNVFAPRPLDDDAILRVHTPEFLVSLKSPRMVAAFLEAPLMAALPARIINRGLLMPFRYASAGTLLAARLALKRKIAVNLGGGFHHAHPHAGEGFCIYADIPIAVRSLQSEKLIQKTLIIDLDVHQGNGTVLCLGPDKNTFTFSMHQGDIYPFPKPKSNIDIELQPGADDQTYLNLLAEQLPRLFELAQPDMVFFQAGCDTLAEDPLASLQMTESGLVQRDAMVIDASLQRQIPLVMTLGGGYSTNAWHAQYLSIRRTLQTYGPSPP